MSLSQLFNKHAPKGGGSAQASTSSGPKVTVKTKRVPAKGPKSKEFVDSDDDIIWVEAPTDKVESLWEKCRPSLIVCNCFGC